MSTNSECQFIEVEPGKWFYALEDYDSPRNSYWLEHATAYGPFATEEEAIKHLRDNHANPGGHSSMSYHEGLQLSDEWKRLIEEAPSHTRTARSFGRW